MDFASALEIHVPALNNVAPGMDVDAKLVCAIELEDGREGSSTAKQDGEEDIWVIGDDEEEEEHQVQVQDLDNRDKIQVLTALEDIASEVKRRSLQDSMMFLGAPHSDVAPSYRRDVRLVSDAELFGAAFLESDTFTHSFEDYDAPAGISPSTSLFSLDSFLFSAPPTPATPATPFECDEVKPFADIPESCTHSTIMPSTWTLEEMTAALLSCSTSVVAFDECCDAEVLREDLVDSESVLSVVAYLASLAVEGTLPTSHDSFPASPSCISNSDPVIKYLHALVQEKTCPINSGHRRTDYLVSSPTTVDDDIARGLCELPILSTALTTKGDSLGVALTTWDRGGSPSDRQSAPADCCAVRIPVDKRVEEPGAPHNPNARIGSRLKASVRRMRDMF